MADPVGPNEHIAFAQALASLRGTGRSLRRRIENDAAQPVQKLLLVEDDTMMRALLAATLSPESYDIVEVGTAAQALAALKLEAPSVVVLDLRLPDRSGVEVCRAIRANPATASVPIIVVTGAADNALHDAVMAAGADRFLTKPFSPLQLLRTVEELVCSDDDPQGPGS